MTHPFVGGINLLLRRFLASDLNGEEWLLSLMSPYSWDLIAYRPCTKRIC
jgi:hypothetical protein